MAPEDPASDEGRILAPEELDLADKDGVEELDEGRYVVSADGTPPAVETKQPETPGSAIAEPEPSELQLSDETSDPDVSEHQADQSVNVSSTLDDQAAQQWYEQQLRRSPTEFGYYMSMKVDDNIDHHTVHSDDITTAFNDLLVWYANNVDTEMPPGAVLGILLSEASVPIQFPVAAFEEFLIDRGLSTDDTIEDLLSELRAESDIVFPPE